MINQIYFPCHYLFPRNNDKIRTEELIKGANVIVAVSNDWQIVCYSTLLRDSKQFYMLNIGSLEESLDSIEDLNGPSDTPVYLIVEKNKLRSKDWKKDENAPEGLVPIQDVLTFEYTLDDIVNKISSFNFTTTTKYIATESGFVGEYDIYQLR